MENSVKALYIAGGVLLGVMILSLWVYVFRKGAVIGKNYDADRQQEQTVAFNSQFDRYIGESKQSTSIVQKYYFIDKSNTASDVITCANLAYNINKKNVFDEVNKVEVEVKISPSEILHVYPDENQPKEAFIKGNISSTNKVSFSNFLKNYSEIKTVNINSEKHKSEAETIYKYYFDVKADDIHYSEITGKIDKIIFTLYTTKMWNSF